jgi:phosphopantetheinyl transferase (holo-ACP synthase)
MVGNDIVDLEEAKKRSNWERPRYLEKLFTSKELQFIRDCENPFLMVWRLWSMKESAYKLYTQLNPSRFYSPKSFECEIQFNNGSVKFKDFKCLVKTNTTSKYILSEARFIDSEITSKIIELKGKRPKRHSNILKEALLIQLSKLHQLSKENFKFQKSEFSIPTVLCNSVKIQVSISHHGCFGTYAI